MLPMVWVVEKAENKQLINEWLTCLLFVSTCGCWCHGGCDPVIHKFSIPQSPLDILVSQALLLSSDGGGHDRGHHGVIAHNLANINLPLLALLTRDQGCVCGLLGITQGRSWECGGGWCGGHVKYFSFPEWIMYIWIKLSQINHTFGNHRPPLPDNMQR